MSDTTPIALAVIGGTGLYKLAGLDDAEAVSHATPYGEPSGAARVGSFKGHRVAFLARHGEGHTVAPHRINYRANLWLLHELGVKRVLAVNAVGGITERYGPRAVGVPDQLIDYTDGRLSSYCDAPGAEVRHIDFGEPYTASLRRAILAAAAQAGVEAVDGGTYGTTQGPRLETRAEVARMRRDGCDLVGMTGMPEAALARELGMEYACVALVANWAAGCGPTPDVEITMDEVFANLAAATATVPLLLEGLLRG
ncbi:S-methyl-5'-thioinosine phosphorylase [Coralloluteibacterium thermophilus]|uniref:Probable S-methyl-5'-thioinosine phosphorylase n=1 Tax=Coralloluteibacterium thermophilum TaxID=2707049 RepID=A0ABV9NN63_9GAMM